MTTTPTLEQPVTAPTTPSNDVTPVIDQDVNRRVQLIRKEMNESLLERAAVIDTILVARIAGLHVVMRGPGGTGKSMLSRTLTSHIDGAVYFETAFDETTDPSQVFGPVNIKRLAEEGVTSFNTLGMLPEATDVFADEFFNANVPLLHSLQPALNERLHHNGGVVTNIPLRSCVMATNLYNLAPELAPLFDRVHMRTEVKYLTQRSNMKLMIANSMARLAQGRGAMIDALDDKTMVTLAELDQAFQESLTIDMSETVFDLFCDLREELKQAGIEFSDRRFNDGMRAVNANAWLRNHESVQPVDLDVLASMWWTHDEQITAARGVILGAANPGEKKALEFLDALDELKKEIRDVQGQDEEKIRRISIQAMRNTEGLVKDAETERDNALAAGLSTTTLDDVLGRAHAFRIETAREVFGLSEAEVAAMR